MKGKSIDKGFVNTKIIRKIQATFSETLNRRKTVVIGPRQTTFALITGARLLERVMTGRFLEHDRMIMFWSNGTGHFYERQYS
jgi:hypothetical protein